MAAKGILTQGGDGTAIPAGVIGELFGSVRNGTNSKIYETTSTTAPTTSPTTLLTLTLNKGLYLFIAECVIAKQSATATQDDLFIGIKGGGTDLDYAYGKASYPGIQFATNTVTRAKLVLVTADSTNITVIGYMSLATASSAANQCYAVRLA